MNTWLPVVLSSMVSVIASSGFWAYLARKDNKKDATTRLLMGLAYDKVTNLGVQYIERGHITRDELEEYQKYFYEPYKALGGNGVAERIWREVTLLPLHPHSRYTALLRTREHERSFPNVRIVSPRLDEEAAPE